MVRKQKRNVGDVLRIDLGRGLHTYCRVLPQAVFGFYDLFSKRELPVDEVIGSRILFKIAVMNRAVTSGRWPIVGHAPLQPDLEEPPQFFIQDSMNPRSFRIYTGGQERVASREECVGLERAAVWEPENVEDRLRDHHAGKPNAWVNSLKIRG